MIDKDVFAWELTLLGDRFEYDVPENSITLMYAILCERMTEKGFISACKKAYLGEAFPRIEELIMLAQEVSSVSYLIEPYQRGFNDGYNKSSQVLTEYYSSEIARLHAKIVELQGQG